MLTIPAFENDYTVCVATGRRAIKTVSPHAAWVLNTERLKRTMVEEAIVVITYTNEQVLIECIIYMNINK